jgi:hypothetical protein
MTETVVHETASRVEEVFAYFETDLPPGFKLVFKPKVSRLNPKSRGEGARFSRKDGDTIIFRDFSSAEPANRYSGASHEALHAVRFVRGLYGKHIHLGQYIVEEGLAYHYGEMSRRLFVADGAEYPEVGDFSVYTPEDTQLCVDAFANAGRMVRGEGGNFLDLVHICGNPMDRIQTTAVGISVMSKILGSDPLAIVPANYLRTTEDYYQLAAE